MTVSTPCDIPMPSIETSEEHALPPLSTWNQGIPRANTTDRQYATGSNIFQQPQIWNSDTNEISRPAQQFVVQTQLPPHWTQQQSEFHIPQETSNNITTQIQQIRHHINECDIKAEQSSATISDICQKINSIEQTLYELKAMQEEFIHSQCEFEGVKKYCTCESWKDVIENDVAIVQRRRDRAMSKEEMDEERRLVLGAR